jgi:hypothetical protein
VASSVYLDMSETPILHGYDIVCFSSIDWQFIWQGHQEIMSTLAANGNRVLFVENTGVRAPAMRDLPRVRQRLRNWWRGTKASGGRATTSSSIRRFCCRSHTRRLSGGSTAFSWRARFAVGCARSASAGRLSGRFCRHRSSAT